MRSIYSFPMLVLLFILLDQVSKYLIRQSDGFYICNKGIAFGINIPEIIFWSIWIIIFGFIIYYLFKNKSEIYFLSFIVAGAISNLIDRLYLGCVIDFIDFKIWPVFNLADSFIVIGAIMIIVKSLKSRNKIDRPTSK